MTERRVAVIGGGIAGLAAAFELASTDRDVTLFEAGPACGGRLAGSDFAGIADLDAGADAFLARVPDAVELAHEVGIGAELVSPEPVGAAVWYDGLHPIPQSLLLGVPGRLRPLATSGLFSVRGKLRAAIEPLLPRTSTESDSLGRLIRARFGNEVHTRLVDALVGSIYATDTDHFSLAEVPQLCELARHRSLLLGARRRVDAGTATASSSPIFAAPRGGLTRLVAATATAIERAGGVVDTGRRIQHLGRDGHRWRVDDDRFDAVVLALPAAAARALLHTAAPDTAAVLATAETADVAMITLHVASDEWPDRARGLSGYLAPKPVQRSVTAVSFGSQKWAHWRPAGGGEILRASIGRDGAPVPDVSDDDITARVLDDLALHLGVRFTPRAARVSRWPDAFAQYRPHHRAWVAAVERSLPPGLLVTGSSYRGIGVPACVRDGRDTARRADVAMSVLQD